jgi:hypothetical protein
MKNLNDEEQQKARISIRYRRRGPFQYIVTPFDIGDYIFRLD